MGIENSTDDYVSLHGYLLSLPLMGIENAKGLADEEAEEHDSLPLMGIENLSRDSHGTELRLPHYPSWGSKTRSTQDR